MPVAKPKSLLHKIAAASAEMDNPKKRSNNPHYSSKFANLRDTMDIIEPVLEAHKLGHVFYFDGTALTYQVFDLESDGLIVSRLDIALLMENLDKNPWQGIGQAFTYLRRYLSQAFWGMIPEDDDGESAPSRAPAAQRATQPSSRNGAEAAEQAAAVTY